MILRRTLWLMSGFIALMLAIVITGYVLISQQASSRWLLSQVPGLTVEGFSGTLSRTWQAQRLLWSDGEQQVELLNSQIQWSPSCLLRAALCLNQLQVETLNLNVAPSEPSDSAFSLPNLDLPVEIEVSELTLGQLNIQGQAPLANISLKAVWRSNALQIAHAGLSYGDYRLAVMGSVRPRGDWPTALEAQVQLPAPDDGVWNIAVKAHGQLQKTLTLNAQSHGYLEAELDGTLQALAENLPAQLTLRSPSYRATPDLAPELTLKQVEINALGDLAKGYAIVGTAQLPGVTEPVAVSLQGTVNAAGAHVEQLRLAVSEERYATVQGQLDWQDEFSVQATLLWQQLPWGELYRQAEPSELAIEHLQADFHYAQAQYQGHIKGEFEGPAGLFSLSSEVQGDLEQVLLQSLHLQAGEGRLQGQLQLGFSEQLSWQAAFDIAQLNPAYWLEQMPGSLNGRLHSEGSYKDSLSANAHLQLDGRLRGQNAQLHVEAKGQGEHWQVPQLLVRLGSNQITGQGLAQNTLQGRVQIQLPQLAQLWTDLRGSINGQLQLAGTLQAPQAELRLQGSRVHYAGNDIESIQLSSILNAKQQLQLDLTSQGVHLGDWLLGQLTLKGQGDRQQQQLSVRVTGDALQAALEVNGQLHEQAQGYRWQGQLRSGSLDAGEQHWRLAQAVPIDYQADGRLQLGAMCWRATGASLCGEAAQLAPNLHLNYQLKNFDLAGLSPFLPEDFAWQGLLFADIDVRMPSSGPQGKISVRADNGVWRVRNQNQWLDFPYRQLNLTSQLSPSVIDTSLRFSGEKLGSIDGQLRIDPRTARKSMQGNVNLTGLELGILRPFIDEVSELSGKLQGQLQIAGDLLTPQLNGHLLLSEGRVSGGMMPTDIEQLRIQAQIAGEQLQLSGNWRSGETGQASLNGTFTWSSNPQGELHLIGSSLPIKYEPYASVEANPDLTISLSAKRIAISGEIDVPRGDIVVRELPESTVSVSSDAVVIGREEQVSHGPQIAMNILVKVGSDKLKFSAFGLTSDLVGNLRITDNLETRGELELVNGRFRAYGQRLSLRRALLTFNGPIGQPYLDVEAVRRVEGVVAGLRIRGPASQPRSDVFSEPPMSQEEALSYLVLGRPMIAGSGNENNVLAQAALNLGLAGTSKITGGLMSRLGISDFDLDSQGEGENASVVASGRLSERLSMFYGIGVFNPMATFGLRYTITQRLYLEAASGLASSIDIFYRRDF